MEEGGEEPDNTMANPQKTSDMKLVRRLSFDAENSSGPSATLTKEPENKTGSDADMIENSLAETLASEHPKGTRL